MAQQDLATIKNWFKTGLIPTQAQFWDTLDSFVHKTEGIAIGAITGLSEFLAPFNDHVNDVNAHASLFAKAKIYAPGQLQIFKRTGENMTILEEGDYVKGIVENSYIEGVFQGGDPTQLASYDILNQLDF